MTFEHHSIGPDPDGETGSKLQAVSSLSSIESRIFGAEVRIQASVKHLDEKITRYQHEVVFLGAAGLALILIYMLFVALPLWAAW